MLRAGRGMNPFASGGYSFRRAVFTTWLGHVVRESYQEPAEAQHGFNIGLGFRSRLGVRWAFTAEYRYTHWSVHNEIQPRDLMDRRNQHEMLISLGL